MNGDGESGLAEGRLSTWPGLKQLGSVFFGAKEQHGGRAYPFSFRHKINVFRVEQAAMVFGLKRPDADLEVLPHEYGVELCRGRAAAVRRWAKLPSD